MKKINLTKNQKITVVSGLTAWFAIVCFFVWNYAPMVEFYSTAWKVIALFLVLTIGTAYGVFSKYRDEHGLITRTYSHRNIHKAPREIREQYYRDLASAQTEPYLKPTAGKIKKGTVAAVAPVEPSVIHFDVTITEESLNQPAMLAAE